jgi:hypothetical protein
VEYADISTNGIQGTKAEDPARRENIMPQKPSVATYLETLMRQTHKSEAEVLTLAFQTGLRQLWREHILGRYLRREIPREEAVDAVGLPWVELAERQHAAMLEDLAWALEQ